MARYIDADKFAEAICNFPAIDEHSANAVISLLHRHPTADVVEVKHALWELVNEDENVWMCTGKQGCGNEFVIIEGDPFINEMFSCPRCGARMSAVMLKGGAE